MYKEYKIVRNKTGEELEAFSTMAAAEQFLIMMSAKGEDIRIVTDKDQAYEADDHPGIEIEGLDIEEPKVEFGSDLDVFNEDSVFQVDEDNNHADVEIEIDHDDDIEIDTD